MSRIRPLTLAVGAAFALVLGSIGALPQVAAADSAPGTLTRASLEDAPIPASCQHSAVSLTDGTYDWGSDGSATLDWKGAVLGELDGGTGEVAVATLDCNAGGVDWPNWVLVYAPGPELIGSYDLADHDYHDEHASVTGLSLAGGVATFRYAVYNGADQNVSLFTGTVRDGATGVSFTSGSPLALDYSTVYAKKPLITRGNAVKLAPAPAPFRRYVEARATRLLASHRRKHCHYASGVTVDRYSHLGYASGDEGDGCVGGGTAVWGRVHGRWTQLAFGQVAPTCTPAVLARRTPLGRALHALALACMTRRGTARYLGSWPKSGV